MILPDPVQFVVVIGLWNRAVECFGGFCCYFNSIVCFEFEMRLVKFLIPYLSFSAGYLADVRSLQVREFVTITLSGVFDFDLLS